MSPTNTIPFVLFSPIAGVVLSPLKKKKPVLYRSILFAIPLANVAALLLCGINGEVVSYGPLRFSLEEFSYSFTLLLNVCWALSVLYSSAFVAYQFQNKAAFFYRLFSLAIATITATGLAANLLTAFAFYLAAIPIVYPLVTIRGGEEAESGGRWYLFSTLAPALLVVFPMLLWIDRWTDPLTSFSISEITKDPWEASLLLAGFVIGFSKNCVAPFSGWLPRTAQAPAPVSALVHSVGAVHTGTITTLKVVVYLYGSELAEKLSERFFHTGWLLFLCGGTALYTAYRAWKTNDLKKRFSYSTVGQLSYVLSAVVIGSPNAIRGAFFHIVTHSVAKMTLFFAAGTYNSVYKTVRTEEIASLAPTTRGLVLVIGICGLSIAGFPFLAGYYSKDLMLLEELHRHHYAAAGFLLAGSAMNFLYIAPILRAGLFGRAVAGEGKTIPRAMKLSLCLGVLAVVVLSLALGRIVH